MVKGPMSSVSATMAAPGERHLGSRPHTQWQRCVSPGLAPACLRLRLQPHLRSITTTHVLRSTTCASCSSLVAGQEPHHTATATARASAPSHHRNKSWAQVRSTTQPQPQQQNTASSPAVCPGLHVPRSRARPQPTHVTSNTGTLPPAWILAAALAAALLMPGYQGSSSGASATVLKPANIKHQGGMQPTLAGSPAAAATAAGCNAAHLPSPPPKQAAVWCTPAATAQGPERLSQQTAAGPSPAAGESPRGPIARPRPVHPHQHTRPPRTLRIYWGNHGARTRIILLFCPAD